MKDKRSLASEAYKKCDRFSRTSEMLINDHAIKFELHKITKSHEREVLANIANLIEEEKHLYRTAVNEMKYKIMRKQVKKIFTSHYF